MEQIIDKIEQILDITLQILVETDNLTEENLDKIYEILEGGNKNE